jgi:putative transposase
VVEHLIEAHDFSIAHACRSAGLSRSAWYRPLKDWIAYDQPVMNALQDLAEAKPGLVFWKLHRRLRRQGHGWNHKRVYRVYCALRLNIRRRQKKRLPSRDPQPLMVPTAPNLV